jgi:hypothetical protein
LPQFGEVEGEEVQRGHSGNGVQIEVPEEFVGGIIGCRVNAV